MRRLYSFAIFVTIVYIVIALIQSVIYFQLGRETYSLESFRAWFALGNILSLLGLALFLKYCHYRGYQLVFKAGIVMAAAALFQVIVVLSALSGVAAMGPYYVPAYVVVLVTGMIFSACIVFSEARNRFWLRWAGVFSFALGVALLSAVAWYATSQNPHKLEMLEKFHQWIGFAGIVGPLLMTVNFMSELTLLRRKAVDTPPFRETWADTAIVTAGALTVFATLILGTTVAKEAAGKLSWSKQLSVKALEWSRLFESKTYVNKQGDILKYQLLKPVDYDPQKSYPLVVCLPYGGGVEGCPPAQMLLTNTNRINHRSFLFVPTCPDGAGWGGIPNYPTIDLLVFESIQALEAEIKGIDTSRLYVTGVSRGGYGSWHFISSRPDMFAAAVPVCGGGDPGIASKIAGVAVWAFHGEDDRNVPVNRSREMITAMKAAGGDPKYTEYPDAGHDIWDRVTKEPGLLDWLFAQKRN